MAHSNVERIIKVVYDYVMQDKGLTSTELDGAHTMLENALHAKYGECYLYGGDKRSDRERIACEAIDCRQMAISCIVYRTDYNFVEKGELRKYGVRYGESLGKELAIRLFNNQKELISRSKIKTNVFEDGEGVSYNSVDWAK